MVVRARTGAIGERERSDGIEEAIKGNNKKIEQNISRNGGKI